jgi:ATP-dependent Clp protease ATP-binding subunit ClpC
MFEFFTEPAVRAIMLAQEEARRMGHNLVGSEQVLLGLIRERNNLAAQVLDDMGVTLEAARRETEKIIGRGTGVIPAELPFTPNVRSLFEQSLQFARQQGHTAVTPEYILLALSQAKTGVAIKVLDALAVDLAALQALLIHAIGEVATVAAGGPSDRPRRAATAPSDASVLTEFGTDLTTLAAAGKLDPVVGRAVEIERVVQILSRRTKNNPILVGEPGVGKTAIAEGLAQRIANQDVPESLADRRVVSLDLGLLLAGTRMRGDFEERISAILAEVRSSGNVILVIDEVHTLVGAGATQGGMDAANLLKPALARGELQCIGATTLKEFRQSIETDAALERRFQPVMVGAPTVDDAIAILYGLRDRYEHHHQVQIDDAAIVAAVTLADRYIPDRQLPDKAIDLIDEAGSRVRFAHPANPSAKALQRELRQVSAAKQEAVQAQDFVAASQWRDRELALLQQIDEQSTSAALHRSAVTQPTVTASDIAQIVGAWTGIPVQRLTEAEAAQMLHLEDTLHQRVIGQEAAVRAVARAMRRSRAGLQGGDRPVASFFFSGPTGVGKTELAKALAASMFGTEEHLIRLDMSEYMEPQSTAKLIGAPPGYVGYGEGGQLTEAVRRKPHSVILLDEVEKAHPDVFNLLLQVLDDGRLTDAQGRRVDFSNTVIIMTSNLGSRAIEKGGTGLGFGFADDAATAQYQRVQSLVQDELKQFFRPEFLNRLDDIIVFQPLTRAEVGEIAKLLVQSVADRLTEQGIELTVSDRLIAYLANEGYSPNYGARSLRRVVTQRLEDALAEAMLRGQVGTGDRAIADLDDDHQVIIHRPVVRQPAAALV